MGVFENYRQKLYTIYSRSRSGSGSVAGAEIIQWLYSPLQYLQFPAGLEPRACVHANKAIKPMRSPWCALLDLVVLNMLRTCKLKFSEKCSHQNITLQISIVLIKKRKNILMNELDKAET